MAKASSGAQVDSNARKNGRTHTRLLRVQISARAILFEVFNRAHSKLCFLYTNRRSTLPTIHLSTTTETENYEKDRFGSKSSGPYFSQIREIRKALRKAGLPQYLVFELVENEEVGSGRSGRLKGRPFVRSLSEHVSLEIRNQLQPALGKVKSTLTRSELQIVRGSYCYHND